MTRFRKKPVEVDAMQWTGDNAAAIVEWTGPTNFYELDPEDRGDNPDATASLYVAANSQWLGIVTGEWIIRDSKGFYPCKADVFAATYEPVDADGAYDTAPTGQPPIIDGAELPNDGFRYQGQWIESADGEGCINVGCPATGRHFHPGGVEQGSSL